MSHSDSQGICNTHDDQWTTGDPGVPKPRRARRGATAAARCRPGQLAGIEAASKLALKSLATRYQQLTAEITTLDTEIEQLAHQTAPQLMAIKGVGADTAGALLAAGDNPERLRSESAFAHLCGVALIPASSGKTNRHHLNRGGNRDANRALYVLALGRIGYDERTREYAARRTTEGKTKREIIRCIKRYLAREDFTALLSSPPITAMAPTQTTSSPGLDP